MANPSASPAALPAHAQIIQMGTAYWVSQFIYTAAEMRLADHLADGPRSAQELAAVTGTHPRALHRFMRTLASIGVLADSGGGRFAVTPLGAALKADAPGSARSTVLAMGGSVIRQAFAEFRYSLETGQTSLEKVAGMPFFDYLAQHPDEAAQFSEAMVGIHGAEPPAVAAAYDFSTCATIVDVGGATGNMLAAILSRYPGVKGVLFDRPYVVPEASALLEARGVAARVTIEAGDFFEEVPAGGDAYVLSHIIHDWSEAQCLTILGHCRKAMKPESRLLIVETVLPEGDAPHQGKLQDMVMLVVPGGQERTAEEYRALLAKAGFRMTRVVPTTSVVSVVEALPA
jgi:hypothetical protein